MYKELRQAPRVEPLNLISADGQDRAADVLLAPSVHGTAKWQALDVTVVSPDNKAYVQPARTGSDKVQFKAARAKHQDKLKHFENLLKAQNPPLNPQTFDYEKVPLVFEATGAWGPETQKWWKKVLKLYDDVEADPVWTRFRQGRDFTWSANRFSTWWTQRISCAYMRHLGESMLAALPRH